MRWMRPAATVAHETQDRCQCHTQERSVYHYHSLSSCMDDRPGADGNSKLVGYALDGFGIYGSYEDGRQLTSADLDAFYGCTSIIEWDGRKVAMYSYVATPDYRYTVGCLSGTWDRALVRQIGGPGGPPPFGGPPRR